MNVKEEIWTRNAYTRTAINLVSAIDDEVRQQQNTVFTSRASFDRTLLAERSEFEKRLERRQRRRPREGVIDLNKSDGLYEEVERQLFFEDEQKTRDEHEAQLAKEHPLAFLDEELEFMLSSYNMLSMLRQKLELLSKVVEDDDVAQTKIQQTPHNTNILVNDNTEIISSHVYEEKSKQSLNNKESSEAISYTSKSTKFTSTAKFTKNCKLKKENTKFFVPQHKSNKLEQLTLSNESEVKSGKRMHHKVDSFNDGDNANINMIYHDICHSSCTCDTKFCQIKNGHKIPRWAEQITHLRPSLQNYMLSLMKHTYQVEYDVIKRRYNFFEPKAINCCEEMCDNIRLCGVHHEEQSEEHRCTHYVSQEQIVNTESSKFKLCDANSSSCNFNLVNQDVDESSNENEGNEKRIKRKKLEIDNSTKIGEIRSIEERMQFISNVYARQENLCKACIYMNGSKENNNSKLEKHHNSDKNQKILLISLAEEHTLPSVDTINAERPWYLRNSICVQSPTNSEEVNRNNLYVNYTNIKLENEFTTYESDQEKLAKSNEELKCFSEDQRSEMEWYRSKVTEYLWPKKLENGIQHTLCAIINTRVRKWKLIETDNIHTTEKKFENNRSDINGNVNKTRSRRKPLNITSLPSTAKFG